MIYLELFWSFFQIGLFSIGGGYAAMPLIQNQVVDIHPWLTMTQFADIMTIAEMTPGPIAINSATFVGIQVAGLPGAIIATVGCVFPSCVIVMTLLEILYKISDLRYALHLGTVSREQCMALLPTYSKQVSDTQARLTAWHEGTAERLGIEADESRRKRAGFDRVIHFIPGLFNDDLNFRGIEERTASMITAQKAGHVCTHKIDKSELYAEDVQLISKDGKIYYLPVSKAE